MPCPYGLMALNFYLCLFSLTPFPLLDCHAAFVRRGRIAKTSVGVIARSEATSSRGGQAAIQLLNSIFYLHLPLPSMFLVLLRDLLHWNFFSRNHDLAGSVCDDHHTLLLSGRISDLDL